MWVEKEYVWDPKVKGRQKTNSELADDVSEFLEPYGVRHVFIDPSAESMQVELKRRGLPVMHANNDVDFGIGMMTSEMQKGNLFICSECTNTIREIEGYVWDPKQASRGYDVPLKKNDHCVDALRYVVASHKVTTYDPYKQTHNPVQYMQDRFSTARRY